MDSVSLRPKNNPLYTLKLLNIIIFIKTVHSIGTKHPEIKLSPNEITFCIPEITFSFFIKHPNKYAKLDTKTIVQVLQVE